MIGKTISHYKILDKLGGGGMGVVYKAEDTKLRRTVAMKFLPLELTGDPEAKRRFINEAQAASSLQHHNICTVHEIDETPEGQLFICMDCYEGDTLKEKIDSGPLPLDEVVEIATQVAEGLRKAHEAGVVHRDIKPANILVTPDGVVKILDFGLAKLVGETRLTRTGSTVGTPAYMSPEQVRGTDSDQRTDIWSLGAVMHEMIAGRLPFAGDHVQALLYSILNEEPGSLSDARPEIPAELENIVKNALQKSPEDRYASADRMLADLGKISSRTQAPRAKTSDKSWRWAAIAALLIAASVFLYPHITGRVSTTKAEARTLAVVDFDNLGGDEASHLTGGLAEEISVKLSKLGAVRVVNGDDVRRLRKHDMPAKEVASKLGAEFAVGGSMLRANGTIRITPQLIDASTGDIVWSERFDREFTDILEFLDEVSLRIADALALELTPSEQAALQERPTDNTQAYDHYLKGREFYYRSTFRNNDLAEKEYKRALQLDPDYPLAMAGLADAYVQRYVERYDYDEFWLDEADRLIDRALEFEPDLAEAYESRAEALTEKENYAGALEAAARARDLRPEWDEPYLRLGRVYKLRGEGSLALQMFETALGIRPSVEAWCGMGEVFYERGAVDSAEAAYRKAAALDPDHDLPFYNLGSMFSEEMKLDEAEIMLRKAIELRPDRGRNYEELAYALYVGKGRADEAEELLRGFAEKYPYNVDAHQVLFEFLAWFVLDYPSALAAVQDAVQLNPDRVWPYLLLAEAHSSRLSGDDDIEKSEAAIRKAQEIRPESGRVHGWVGYIYTELGDEKQALHHFRQALQINPGSNYVLYGMARFLNGVARYDSAAVVATEAVRQAPGLWYQYSPLERALSYLLRPDEYLDILQDATDKYGGDNVKFYKVLGDAQRLAGDYEKAIESYRRVISGRSQGDSRPLIVDQSVSGLGMTQWLMGDTDEALALMQSATENEDNFYWWDLGQPLIDLLKYEGRFDEIEALLQRLKDDNRMDDWAYYARRYYPSMRDYDKALSMAEEAMESEGVTSKSDLALYSVEWQRLRGDLSGAEESLADIESSYHGFHSELDNQRAEIEAAKGNIELALRFAKTAYEGATWYYYRQQYILLLGKLCYANGRSEDALEVFGKAPFVDISAGAFYRCAQLAQVTESSDIDEKLRRSLLLSQRSYRGSVRYQSHGMPRVYSALALARMGRSDDARSEIEYALRLEPELAKVAYCAGAAYALLGDTGDALHWLQTAVDRGHQELWWARVDPDLDPIREEPRFKEIMEDWDRRMKALLN